MKNIHGKKGMSAVVGILLGVAIFVLVIGGVSVMMSGIGGGEGEVADIYNPGTCGLSSVLTVQDKSALDAGTDPGAPVITAGVNGGDVATTVTSGTTSFPAGTELELLLSITDYIDESYTARMPCGGLTISAPMYSASSDNPSIRIKNDDGDFMTDAISDTGILMLVNQTALDLGETIVWEVVFQGTNGESSGDGVWILEFNASTNSNITSVTLDGKQPIAVPSVHTLQHAGSEAVAFDIPAIVGAETRSMSLSIELGSGQDLMGYVLTDWYTKQKFIDDDKSIQYGVQDSTGDDKSESTLDFDVYITS